ncbi:peptide chain release factor N(5)-glutamine methyltransferase [Thalassotalea sp. LPB0316]|uniref:peptide chain release factor N(5)-glutamine methyltransferase n=1 Tax=Thalassotalea sp. LPB0316 TaxID=2769490 RepID=UPI0018673C41|nr:peptide chain release factor N(5)-glutamine methyltransferase [Thalassotalea sp. LPB0316]QOL24521.1 peptide chain release factor N(5)-glutamine methyltransferase [Thalassotalea sp. LPB0316]
MFNAPITVKQLIGQASQLLNDKSDSQQLDCQILLCYVLAKPKSYLLTWPDAELTSEQLATFSRLFERRLAGEPIAYIVGEQEFWSLPLKVSSATLIPRPDTETLVELVLNHHQAEVLNVLDLGTGTGAIALALASEQSQWQIEAVDFNCDAVALANENKINNDLTNVEIYQSDWFSNVNGTFDVIVSNPPYIDEQDPHLSQGDVRYEPSSALVAPEQGLKDLRHIIDNARKYFKATGGWLYLEHGYDQAEQVRALLKAYGYQAPKTQKDLGDNPRITYASFLA